MSTVKIYAIVNPKNDEVIYVGASITPDLRYARHSIAAEWHPVTHRYKVVKQLQKERVKVVMKILEECLIEEAHDRENYWINYHKGLGCKIQQLKSSYPGERIMQRRERKKRWLAYWIAQQNGASKKELQKLMPCN